MIARSSMKAAKVQKAMSSNKAKTNNMIPTASPSFPVTGAGIKAATTTTTRTTLITIVAKYWNAVAALSEEVQAGCDCDRAESKKDGLQRQGEGRLPTPLLSLGYSRSRPMLGFVVGDDTSQAFVFQSLRSKTDLTLVSASLPPANTPAVPGLFVSSVPSSAHKTVQRVLHLHGTIQEQRHSYN